MRPKTVHFTHSEHQLVSIGQHMYVRTHSFPYVLILSAIPLNESSHQSEILQYRGLFVTLWSLWVCICCPKCLQTHTFTPYTLIRMTRSHILFFWVVIGCGSEDVFIITMKKPMSSFGRMLVSLSQNWVCPSEGGPQLAITWRCTMVVNSYLHVTQKYRAMQSVTEQSGVIVFSRKPWVPILWQFPLCWGFQELPAGLG